MVENLDKNVTCVRLHHFKVPLFVKWHKKFKPRVYCNFVFSKIKQKVFFEYNYKAVI